VVLAKVVMLLVLPRALVAINLEVVLVAASMAAVNVLDQPLVMSAGPPVCTQLLTKLLVRPALNS